MARRNLSGGPVFESAAADLLPASLPVGRLVLQVKAGRAGAYLTATDNISGDTLFMRFVALDGGGTADVVIRGADGFIVALRRAP